MRFFKKWVIATRIETTALAIASTGLGSALAAFTGNARWLVGILTVLTASLLQIVCNLANDYGDFVHGADPINTVKAPSAIQTGLVTLTQVRKSLLWLAGVAVGLGVLLLYTADLSRRDVAVFLFLGALAMIAAITYTLGNKPYGYRGWGDVAVFIFFGLMGVGGTFYLHTRQLHSIWILPAISYGSLVVGVLNINNLRDMYTDVRAGKNTIPVRIGRSAAVYYHWCLLTTSIVATLGFLWEYAHTWTSCACLCTMPWLFKHGMVVGRQAPEQLTKQLQSLVLFILVFAALLSMGLLR